MCRVFVINWRLVKGGGGKGGDLCKHKTKPQKNRENIIDQMPDHALGVMTDVNHLKCLCNNHDLKKKLSGDQEVTKTKQQQHDSCKLARGSEGGVRPRSGYRHPDGLTVCV